MIDRDDRQVIAAVTAIVLMVCGSVILLGASLGAAAGIAVALFEGLS